MRRACLTAVVLVVALFGLDEVLCRYSPNADPFGTRLCADDTAPKDAVTPTEEESLSEQQKEKIALVLETGAHSGGIPILAFLPDQHELVSASNDGTVRWWDAAGGELLRVLRPRLGRLSAMAVSPRDGRFVAVAGREDGNLVVQVIQPATGKVRWTLKGHTKPLRAVAFSGDGKWLAGAGHEQGVCLWSLETKEGKLVKEFQGNSSRVPDLAFFKTKDGLRLVTGGVNPAILSVLDGKVATELKGHTKHIQSIDVSPDGKQIAGAGPGGLFLWDVATAKLTQLSNRPAETVAFAGNSRQLLYVHNSPGDAKQVATLRDIAPNGKERDVTEVAANARAALSSDGEMVAWAGGLESGIWVWRVKEKDSQLVHQFKGRSRQKVAVGWSPDGKTVAFGTEPAPNENRFEGRNPLSTAFSLEKMAFEPKAKTPFETFRRAQLKVEATGRDTQTLSFEPKKGILLQSGNKEPRVLPLPGNMPPNIVICATFVGPDRAAVGTRNGVFLYDTRTAAHICWLTGPLAATYCLAPSPDGRFLLAGGGDMILRIWDLERAQKQPKGKGLSYSLSLFFARPHSWVAWTPEGYYACSPDGDELIGWRKDNDLGQLYSFYPVEHFRKVFYRPDVIAALWKPESKGEELPKILWLADKARNPAAQEKDSVPADVEKVLPPTVTVTEPAENGVRLDKKPDLTIQATVADNGKDPVTSVQLVMDGRPFPGVGLRSVKDAAAGKEQQHKWEIKVPPGRHRFSVVAQTEKASGDSGEFYVTNAAPPPLPRLAVLLIGINDYAHFNKLDCAVPDAEGLHQAFLTHSKDKPQLFGEVRTKLIRNEEATKEGILGGLDWLKENAGEDDVAILFYAGHGERDAQGQFHLVTIDAADKNLAEKAVTGPQLKAALAALKSRRVLVLLDACHSGAIATDDLARELKRPDCGAAVLCAAEGSEYSLESKTLRHGYFTQALLTGLKGDAGKNAAGEITLARLYAFVQEKVPEDTQDRQHPVLVGLAAIRSFALAKP
jgi:WD40 repeat protein